MWHTKVAPLAADMFISGLGFIAGACAKQGKLLLSDNVCAGVGLCGSANLMLL